MREIYGYGNIVVIPQSQCTQRQDFMSGPAVLVGAETQVNIGDYVVFDYKEAKHLDLFFDDSDEAELCFVITDEDVILVESGEEEDKEDDWDEDEYWGDHTLLPEPPPAPKKKAKAKKATKKSKKGKKK